MPVRSFHRLLGMVIAFLAWWAVIVQFKLMLDNRVASVPETVIRFFSFFTILTNLLVAVSLTCRTYFPGSQSGRFFSRPGALAAITVYIAVVGLVYQIVLRPLWSPTGLQRVVDEMLHSAIPLLMLLYWWTSTAKKNVGWRSIPAWLIYPLVYLTWILIRGWASGFYPYPFVHVADLGLIRVLANSAILVAVFAALSAGLIALGRRLER